MSKIKVDAVESRNGTLTLGGTGDTVVYTAGSIPNSSLDNSAITINGTSISLGSSGTIPVGIDWQSSIKAANFTAAAGEGYFVNTTSGAITATLPASPSAGDQVAFKDYAETFGSNGLTIARNGSNIQGNANDSIIETARASVLLVYADATKGWLYTVQSNASDNELNKYIVATGGTITTDGDFKVHTFTSSGTFTISETGKPTGSTTVDYTVVAAGGSGGGGAGTVGTFGGGGGGAGGFRQSFPNPATGGFAISAQAYPITVGAGGAAVSGQGNDGNPGGNSTFSSITSTGGGHGGSDQGPVGTPGGPGGSGGGGSSANGNGGNGNTPSVSPPQGNPGGSWPGSPNPGGGQGGGGASAAGASTGDSGSYGGGPGGAGTANSITGSSVTRSGGGGGGTWPAGSNTSVGAGGAGGGADGAYPAGNAGSGAANTGGGGGGAGHTKNTSGAGGSGVVIIRYKFQN